jgi:BlaI family transcriptional regulator, penicillinase repressor
MKREEPMPTDAELAILRVLWSRGPCTVRDVHDSLSAQGTGYTTVLKLMQIMAAKGLVTRDESRRSHVYSAVPSEEKTQRRLIGELADKAFSGSAAQLVLRALSMKPASREDLAAIRAMLDGAAKGGRK